MKYKIAAALAFIKHKLRGWYRTFREWGRAGAVVFFVVGLIVLAAVVWLKAILWALK